MAYRATTHDNSHCSTNLLMTGREMNLTIDIMTGTSDMSSSCPIQYVEWVKSATNQAFELANSQKKASNSSKEYYDRGLNPREFKRGIWCGGGIPQEQT